MHEQWGISLAHASNTLFGMDAHIPFTWETEMQGGTRAIAYGKGDEHPKGIKELETKGARIFKLGGVAERFGNNRTLTIHHIDPRSYGRLTRWCQGHLGLSTYQIESDRRRDGRPLAVLHGPPGPDVDEPEDEV